jgi:hypothetical protein
MSNEVRDLLTALSEGSLSLEEVAQRFRERTWPPTSPPPPASYLEMAGATMQDPEPPIPGTFDDVETAYARGELTREQYRVLADAIAEAANRQRGPAGHSP